MLDKDTLTFVVFMIHAIAEKWEKSPSEVYEILDSTGILDNYIIKCYDILHTLGKEYLVEDITDFVREEGVTVNATGGYEPLDIMQLNLEEDAINSIATMKEIALRDACGIYYTQHSPV